VAVGVGEVMLIVLPLILLVRGRTLIFLKVFWEVFLGMF